MFYATDMPVARVENGKLRPSGPPADRAVRHYMGECRLARRQIKMQIAHCDGRHILQQRVDGSRFNQQSDLNFQYRLLSSVA
jgi:hypothetical protein